MVGSQDVAIQAGGFTLPGMLTVPPGATGAVIFAHGSGSSRFSSRNLLVARTLQESGLATLLFDLLTEEEDVVYENRFDIGLITERLIGATVWARERDDVGRLPLGYFGASTGAAAALRAAAADHGISAVVSRGGRPDLAMEALPDVRAATLLIVGGNDLIVLDLNRHAFDRMRAEKALEVVEGASHLFEEPGTLEAAASLAADWLRRHLAG